MLHFQALPYIPEIIYKKPIIQYYNNSLMSKFKIKKTTELVAPKYNQSTFYYNVKIYIKCCQVCFVSKKAKDKLYGNF